MYYNNILIPIILATLAVGLAAGYIVKQMLSKKRLESCESLSVRIIDEAKKEAETIKKEAILQAKENLLKVKTEFEKDTRDRKVELDALERRLRSKEENLERRTDLLAQKETTVENREKAISNKESQLNARHEAIDRMLEEQKLKLEQIA
ncbi:MAG TPA: ribonuclease Y, partial [Syntrophus sp. (in: bacteria)]|nr:ribonuclease Y [Syntrophus sp. (in: bacteria)]